MVEAARKSLEVDSKFLEVDRKPQKVDSKLIEADRKPQKADSKLIKAPCICSLQIPIIIRSYENRNVFFETLLYLYKLTL
ncbi:hypothetical protein LCY76_07995 [Fictibacillus sp. KIGAM418]|uniref:Uncharacterized protein n=1 Tax=Fictibacillus marinisediminis TaxID=2878389 RepID=A0A9X1X977_9BACL|nr:hypothetical protein [Fictibacillus marinisediminis]MCK6256532.1 hypothetical protein [Fictibacillus marinisediminis]